ncbi:MAG TPA: tetratricopeptide repeat protein, partial [Longimicrobiales bacterium]
PEPPANDESTASATATATGSDATDETATGSADETATGSADETTSEPAAEPASGEPASRPPRHAAPTIRGKRIVLEYDSQAREAKPIVNAPKNDQAAIGRARTSYAAGNTRLFAGDADGAIRNYRQALAYYPGYIAGYRGLGLAYAQKGDKTNAIRALRTYLSAVPRAKDAPLIRKRIQMLSR